MIFRRWLEHMTTNHSLYVIFGGFFRELDISTRKRVKSFLVKDAGLFVVPHDNKFLITADFGVNGFLTKWSVRTKKQLHTWRSGVKKYVDS